MLFSSDDDSWSLNTPSLDAAAESLDESDLETSAAGSSIPSSMPSLEAATESSDERESGSSAAESSNPYGASSPLPPSEKVVRRGRDS
ncbi:unnamed protein product [Peniophora sp. CBMAI 1063]|nr:unnamed protein product [Peniophora sp. CBMAI 1063]